MCVGGGGKAPLAPLDPRLDISTIHLRISSNDLQIYANEHIQLSSNNFKISPNDLQISATI